MWNNSVLYIYFIFVIYVYIYIILYFIRYVSQIYLYNVDTVLFLCRDSFLKHRKWVYIPNHFLKSFDPFW